MVDLKHEAKVMWDMVKTAWSVVPLKCKYAVYGGLAVLVLMSACGAARAENAPNSNFGFIGTDQDILYACYVSNPQAELPPGVVYTCLVLLALSPEMNVSTGQVSYCTLTGARTYTCGEYEDMRKLATGI